MKYTLAKVILFGAGALLLLGLSTSAEAARGWEGSGGGCQSVAEPTAVLMLGAGLVSLGVYAKKKNGKK